VSDKRSANSSPPQFWFHPNPFEKCNRTSVTAVSIFPNCYFGKASNFGIGRFCNKPSILVTFQQLVDRFGVRLRRIVRP
jgi:hypothetical protein